MKTKLKFLKLMLKISIILPVFTLTNCKDDCPGYPPGGNLIYEFHAEDSLKIPYTGYDTLTFLRTVDSTVKDTVVFIGRGKKYYKEWLRNENEESDCEYSVYAKGYKIDYVAQNEPDLKFEFVREAFKGSSDHVYIRIKGLEFFYSFWRWDWTNGYYEYITFNNKIYRKVQETVVTYDSIKNSTYYNFDYGLIRIDLNFLNEKYQLIN